MEPNQCRVLYIDDRFPAERWVSRTSIVPGHDPSKSSYRGMVLPSELQDNLDALMQVFGQVYVCRSGRTFSSKLAEVSESVLEECSPILALFDIAPEARHDVGQKRRGSQQAIGDDDGDSPLGLQRSFTFTSESDESYGLQLLSRLASDLQVQENGKLIVPIAITRPKAAATSLEPVPEGTTETSAASIDHTTPALRRLSASDSHLMLKCLDAGAVDIVLDRLDQNRVLAMTGHAYRAHKAAIKEQSSFLATKRMRRQSWVGMEEQKPYAYLRESMVRKLMNRICDPEAVVEEALFPELSISEARKKTIAAAVGKWAFCAHDFSEEELVYAASCMLNHATSMQELEKWRLPFSEIICFVQAARSAYNSFVIYHNFRHAIDVLQSLFSFLLAIRILPAYPRGSEEKSDLAPKAPIAALLKPFEAMALLIAAIGHDVGHPGVNNLFLVKLNAPLAQLYNDQSVLEAFHCAAYSQILRQYWPVAFEDKGLRRLLISSILATDMGIHSDYMQQLGHLQSKIHESNSIEGWAPKDMEQYRVLICGLLIKCADISNVARPWAIAERWTNLLQEEFANQGEMEKDVGMESCLFGGPPEIGNMLKLANSQMGFMGLFAIPLFEGVADVLPAMSFAAKEIHSNKATWFSRAEQEKRRELLVRQSSIGEGLISPRSRSPKTLGKKGDARQGSSGEGSPFSKPTRLTDSIHEEDMTIGQASSEPMDAAANESAATKTSSGAYFGEATQSPPPLQARRSSNTIPSSQQPIGSVYDGADVFTDNATSSTFGGGSDENERPRGQADNVPIAGSSNRQSNLSGTAQPWNAVPAIKLTLPQQRGPAHRCTSAADVNQSAGHQQKASAGVDQSTLSTIMTPASTQATSFLSEGTDEAKTSEENGKTDATTERTTSSTAPTTSDVDSRQVSGSNTSPSFESNTNGGFKNHFRTTISHPAQGQRAVDRPHNSMPDTAVRNGTDKTVPRRRSRLNFSRIWRRNKSSSDGGSEEAGG